MPFIPRYDYDGNFDNSTISLNATHEGGLKEYDTHSLFGHMMVKRTAEAMKNVNPKKRSLIISSSTFTGTQASHSVSGLEASWANMINSLGTVKNLNMHGITHSGVDACGTVADKLDEELCARWIQFSSFMPFSRFYASKERQNSEPFNIQGEWKTVAQSAMQDRYRFLRLQYTCLYEAHKNGGSCIDPLLYHFSNDENVFKQENRDFDFMVANSLKITPVL